MTSIWFPFSSERFSHSWNFQKVAKNQRNKFLFSTIRSDDESANEYEEEEISLKQEIQEDDSNGGWQEVIRWEVCECIATFC